MRTRYLTALLAMLFAATAVATDPKAAKLNFESYVIRGKQCDGQPITHFSCLQLPADSKNKRSRHYAFITDPGSNYAYEVQDDPDKGKVLMLQLKPYDDGCVRPTPECSAHKKDKIEFTPVHPDNDNSPDVRDDKPFFLHFEFKLDKSYEVGNRMVLHMQARQEMPGHSPIFAMRTRPLKDRKANPATAPVDLEFVIRDDKGVYAKKAGVGRTSPGEVIHTQRVERGRWYTMTLRMLPAYNGSGRAGLISMWLDGEHQFKYNGDWGYKPLAKPRTARIALALDVYRAPFQTTTQKIYFNNVNFASSYEDVIVNGH